MIESSKSNFWGTIANLILRNRLLILITIGLVTLFLASKWQNMRFTFTEANLLPDTHPENIDYENFIKTFGEEGNLIVIALKDDDFFTEKIFNEWVELNNKINEFSEIDFTLSTNNVQELVKDENQKKFVLRNLLPNKKIDAVTLEKFKQKLLLELPIYKNILYSNDGKSIRSAIYMNKDIVNTSLRKDFIFQTFIPLIHSFEQRTGLDVRVSGMPYIRTLNAQNIVDEIGIFVISAMLMTTFIFFLFFRSFRATFISMFVVIIGVMWAFGFLGWMGYEITILTA